MTGRGRGTRFVGKNLSISIPKSNSASSTPKMLSPEHAFSPENIRADESPNKINVSIKAYQRTIFEQLGTSVPTHLTTTSPISVNSTFNYRSLSPNSFEIMATPRTPPATTTAPNLPHSHNRPPTPPLTISHYRQHGIRQCRSTTTFRLRACYCVPAEHHP